MPRFNRIIGFLSVSFLLLFVAKINKVELFSAYFKTIADVEIRNSQALYDHGIEATLTQLPSSIDQSPRWSPSFGAAQLPELLEDVDPASQRPRFLALPELPVVLLPLIPQVSPRAPSIQA